MTAPYLSSPKNKSRVLWDIPNRVPHIALSKLFKAKNQLIVLRHGQPPYQVVIGVPHQVPDGIWRICEERFDQFGRINSRKGDDNVVSIGLVIFSQLRSQNIPCKLVVMARASKNDPNKVLDTPYCREVFREPSHLLFECHASSGKRTLQLELSAGSNFVTDTLVFGEKLAHHLSYQFSLGIQTKAAQRDALIFQVGGDTATGQLQLPATKTTSLWAAGQQGIPALHLEAKPQFRIVRGSPNTVSPDGLALGQAVADTIVTTRNKLMMGG